MLSEVYPYAILLTQTCDTQKAKDFLFMPADNSDNIAEQLATQEEQPILEEEFRRWVVNNLHPRYHFFEKYEHDGNVILPELVGNFRRTFSLRAEYVKEKLIPEGHRIAALHDCYRAELGHRFGQFYSRVATDRNMESL